LRRRHPAIDVGDGASAGGCPLAARPRRAGVDAPPAGAGGAAGGGRRAGAAASDSESLPKTDPGPNRPQEPDLPGIARHWNSAGADQPVFPTTPPPLVPSRVAQNARGAVKGVVKGVTRASFGRHAPLTPQLKRASTRRREEEVFRGVHMIQQVAAVHLGWGQARVERG